MSVGFWGVYSSAGIDERRCSLRKSPAIWADADFKEENAIIFTEWVFNEFLPSFPKNIQQRPPQQGKFFISAIFSYYLKWIFSIKDETRAKKAILIVVNCLAMSKKEYLRQVMSLLEYFKGKSSEEEQMFKKCTS